MACYGMAHVNDLLNRCPFPIVVLEYVIGAKEESICIISIIKNKDFAKTWPKLEPGLVSMKQWTQLLTFFLSTCLLAKPLFSLIKSTSVLDKSTFCCSHSDVRRLNLNLRWFATTFCCEKKNRWCKPHFVGRIHMFVCSICAFVCWTVSWTHLLLDWTHNLLATTSILLVKSKFLLVKSVLLLEKSKFS